MATIPKIHLFFQKAQDLGALTRCNPFLPLDFLRCLYYEGPCFPILVPKHRESCFLSFWTQWGDLPRSFNKQNTGIHNKLGDFKMQRMELGSKKDSLGLHGWWESSELREVCGYQHLFAHWPWSQGEWGVFLGPTSDAMNCQRFKNNRSKTNDSLK